MYLAESEERSIVHKCVHAGAPEVYQQGNRVQEGLMTVARNVQDKENVRTAYQRLSMTERRSPNAAGCALLRGLHPTSPRCQREPVNLTSSSPSICASDHKAAGASSHTSTSLACAVSDEVMLVGVAEICPSHASSSKRRAAVLCRAR